MATYGSNEAMDLRFLQTTVAPELIPEKKQVNRPISSAKLQKMSFRKSVVKIAATCMSAMTVLMLFSSVIFMNIRIKSNQDQIASLEAEIKTFQSENVRLKSELNAALSGDKIDKFAVDVLGMQKIERYQVHYFEDRPGDAVTIAGGRSVTSNK